MSGGVMRAPDHRAISGAPRTSSSHNPHARKSLRPREITSHLGDAPSRLESPSSGTGFSVTVPQWTASIPNAGCCGSKCALQ